MRAAETDIIHFLLATELLRRGLTLCCGCAVTICYFTRSYLLCHQDFGGPPRAVSACFLTGDDSTVHVVGPHAVPAAHSI